jgi:outer membrane protein assembly factor BamB
MKDGAKITGPTLLKPLRLWPAIIVVAVQWLLRFGLTSVSTSDLAIQIGFMAGVLGGLLLLIWWLFFSRASRIDRLSGAGLWIAVMVVTYQFLDISIRTANMGLMFIFFSVPVISLTFLVWAALTRNYPDRVRRITMVATIILATGFWVLLRTEGMDGSNRQELVWRWAKSSEDRLLAGAGNKIRQALPDSGSLAAEAEWPGFRGTRRDGIVAGTQIHTDWVKSPPKELWRQPVGPGCSSFAIRGNLLFTQEQRGEYEMVTCYNLKTGEPIWSHADSARFWDSHAGAGPRSTPTLSNGRVYTMGGTGILNALNEADGSVIWSRNAAKDAQVEVLAWGFAGSPLVVGNRVIISLSGKLAGYDATTGELVWSGTDGGNSYSSPHLATLDGVQQVLLLSKAGLTSLEPENGRALWNYECPMMDRILQPAVTGDGDLLLISENTGLRRISVSNDEGTWRARDKWASDQIRQNFNDLVVHKGFAYGFDGPSMACIDLTDGSRKWKGSPYRGFSLLMADQNLLMVLTEKGDLALVEAKPERFSELARIPAINGRTWNHPAIAGNVVVVRNAKEMAAFRLTQ